MSERFDITEVTRAFRANRVEGRHGLLQEFNRAVNDNDEVKLLVGEVLHHCLDQGNSPVQVAKTCLAFGMALGVALQRRKQEERLT